MCHNFSKMASANISKLFHQFGLVATLLLQLHGLLYVYIIYQYHVNERLSIYYAVKRTIVQTFNPRSRTNKAKSNYIKISISHKPSCPGMQQPGSRHSRLPRLPFNQNVKKTNNIYTKQAAPTRLM